MNGGTESYGTGSVPPPGGGFAVAQAKVSGPAIGLMITAGLGIFAQICGLLFRMLGMGIGSMMAENQEQAFAQMFLGTLGIVFGIIGILVGIVVFIGAQKMKKLESYGFAMAVSILAMIPCISPCCILGLPIGIWALVVLVSPEVKAAFR